MSDDKLLNSIRKVIREEVEAEAKKTESDSLFSNVRVINLVRDLKNSVKDLKISNSRIEKGQEELRKEQVTQSKTINGINKTLDEHGKTLKYIKTKLNKTATDVKVVIDQTDRRITDLDNRTDRIEDHLNLPPSKSF